ncbi:ACT domain-containing protein [Pacificispira sp.]|uniref:ACT domain-containing protein n=1 Tax=Pacificispira sp. TaxID=2888761 RepID=UPI003BAA0D23
MTGERDLQKLIVSMEPTLDAEAYVFASVPADFSFAETPLMRFREDEGDTVILSVSAANRAGLSDDRRFKRITLNVHSCLEAVGLTAAFAEKLTAHDISANVVAGFYHDHIFVPIQDAEAALAALRSLSRDAASD